MTVVDTELDHDSHVAGADTLLSVTDLVKNYHGGTRGVLAKPLRRSRLSDGERARGAAVNGVTFDVRPGELFTLLGPSGCGKTTTLRSVAGLERPDTGRIELGGRVLFDGSRGLNVPVNRRGLGMVFQSYAIWPHMTVAKNVSFPLDVMRRGARGTSRETAQRVREALEVTGLAEFAERPATKLSGGQQQRLALARALVVRPPLMLLDEPLSNLDAKLREMMRLEFKRLQRELGLTAVYVTHDQSEALAISSRIAVMRDGKILQVGKPREIYSRPTTPFVADFIGSSNLLRGEVSSVDANSCVVHTDVGNVTGVQTSTLMAGTKVIVSIRPESIGLEEVRDSEPVGTGEIRGSVVNRAFQGDSVDHVVDVAAAQLRVRGDAERSIRPGTAVRLRLDPQRTAVIVVPAEE